MSASDAVPMTPESLSLSPPSGDGLGQTLLAAYPGPALLVKGTVITGQNPAAQPFLESARHWWGEAEPWLKQVQERGFRSPLLVKIPGDNGTSTIEWTAITVEPDCLLLIGRNVTLERSLQEVLTDSRDRFRELVEMTTDLAWETKADGTFSYIVGSKILGYKPEDMLGKKARDFVVRQPLEVVDYFECEEGYDQKQIMMQRADGTVARVLISARPLVSKSGGQRGARGICRDITDSALRQAELARMQRRDRLVAQFVRSLRDAQEAKSALKMAAHEIAIALEAAGCRIYTVAAQEQFVIAAEFGMAPPEIVNSYNRKLKQNHGKLMQEASDSAVLMGATTVHGPDVTGVIWVWRPTEKGYTWHEVDQTLLTEVAEHLGIAISQFDYQEQLRILSECDGMTKLFNRRTLMDLLGEHTTAALQNSALFYVDLDNFKAVNDTHGHQRGDVVINRVADILRETARAGDLTGRIGGDEFVLWMNGLSREETLAMAATLVARGRDLRDLSASADKPLGVSVGVAFLPAGHGMRAASLLEVADQAMYQAKRSGKSSWSMQDASETRPD